MSDPHGTIRNYRKGESIMEAFTDTVGEHILGAIQVDIEQHLFEQWNSLKQSYNEYYGYIEGDEFLL